MIGASGGDVTGHHAGAVRLRDRQEGRGFYVVAEMGRPASMRELDRVLTLADDVVRFRLLFAA